MTPQLSLENFIANLSELTIGTEYQYASVGRSSTGFCELVSVDSETGSIHYRRNGESKIENISGNSVEKLAKALSTRKAVEINALYGGSGNFRSALEALAANTRNVFLCKLDGKKHIFWDPNSSHTIGEVTLAEPPSPYVPTVLGISAQIPVDSFSRPDILAAIRTKPFILLAGISGTGKSRMVRQLARGCCPEWKDGAKTQKHPLYDERKPGNFEMIEVRPNWHDSSQLMGYESRVSSKPEFVVKPFVKFLAKAWLYEDEGIPFFLCLDEMNLAPVEQYFAEYLSVIETRRTLDGRIVTDPLVTFPNEALRDQMLNELYAEKAGEASKIIEMFKKQGGIPIPQNFIVMGTVNMDETTFSFSRKVLDRAMSFELNEVDMDGGLAADPDCAYGSIGAAAAKGEFTQGFEVYAAAQDDCDKVKDFLVEVNKVLDKTPFKIAYRTRNEIMIYCHERAKDGVPLAQALDEATSMKILSRVEGDKRRLVVRDAELPEYNGKPLLDSLLDVILKGLKTVRGGDDDYTESDVCSRKLKEMSGQLENGYTSFWTR